MQISITTLLVGVTCIVAVVAGIVAFVPLYTAASSTAFSTARAFSETIANAAAAQILHTWSRAQDALTAVEVATSRWNVNLTNPESIISTLGYGYGLLGLSCSLFLDDTTYYNVAPASSFNNSVAAPDPRTMVIASQGNTTAQTVTFSVRNATTMAPLPPDAATGVFAPFTQHNTYNVTPRPFYSTIRSSRSWSRPFLDFSKAYSAMTAGMPIHLPNSSTYVGTIAIKFSVENNVLRFLDDLGITPNGRVMLVSPSTNIYFGGNFGESSVITVAGVIVPRQIHQIQDPVVSLLVQSMTESHIVSCSTPCVATIHNYFVRIVSLTDPYGLHLRVFVAIPSSDFLTDVAVAMRVSIGATCGAIVALLLVIALVLVWLLSPIVQLPSRLYRSAAFAASARRSVAVASVILEIDEIETAYHRLQLELHKAKSFLPQNIVQQLEDASSTDSQSGDNATDSRPAPADRGQVVALAMSDGGGPLTVQVRATAAFVDMRQPQTEMTTSAESDFTENEEDGGTRRGCGQRPRNRQETHQRGRESSPSTPGSNGDAVDNNHVGSPLSPNPFDATASDSTSTDLSSHRRRTAAAESRQTKGTKKPHRFARGGGLSAVATLTVKRVTIVMMNVTGFHRSLEVLGSVELQRRHAVLVGTLLSHVNGLRGVIDSFHGDRFVISFNASVTCQHHSAAAASLVVNLREMLLSNPATAEWQIRCGLATGKALCGNFGTERMRRHCAVGSVVTQAFSLMQQTKAEGVSNVINSELYDDIVAERDFAAQHVNFVVLPQSGEGKLISTLMDNATLMSQAGSTGLTRLDVLRRINEAFAAFSRGEMQLTKTLAGRVPREYAGGLLKCLRSVMDTLASLN